MRDKDAYLPALHLMQDIGGGFCHALAEVAFRADGRNWARLLAAFPDIFAQYREHAAEIIDRAESARLAGL